MPRLHEEEDEEEGVFLPETPLSDSSETSEGFRRLHFDPTSVLTPPSDPRSDFLTSSPDHVVGWCNAVVEAERFSASVTGCGQIHSAQRYLYWLYQLSNCLLPEVFFSSIIFLIYLLSIIILAIIGILSFHFFFLLGRNRADI